MGFYRSNISVNLNQSNVCQALLALKNIPKAMEKVKTAHVHASCPPFPLPTAGKGKASKKTMSSSSSSSTKQSHRIESIIEIFRAVGTLPNLTSLTVDLEYFAALPVAALVELLQGPCRLQSLELSRLQLVATTPQDLDLLRLVLPTQTRLRSIQINSCRGNPLIMEALLLDPPALESIHLLGTAIASPSSHHDLPETTTTTSNSSCTQTLAKLLQGSPQLRSLSLVNLPLGQISDQHIQAMVGELAAAACKKLTELTIVSSLLGEETGEAISNLLCLNDSSMIESLTLHIDWEDCGPTVAKMLRSNTTLQNLDFRVYGDEDFITDSVVAMARALEMASLRKLRLCFEFEPRRIPHAVTNAFMQAILSDKNESLGKLVLTDTLEKWQLPVELRTKLRLNRLGVHDLLRHCAAHPQLDQDATSSAATVHETFVEAIISARNDIHVVYDLLSNYPLLCIAPLQQQSQQVEKQSQSPPGPSTPICLDHLDSSTSNNALIPSTRRGGGSGKDPTAPFAPTVAMHVLPTSTKKTAKKLGRKVRSFFAPSA